MHPGGSRGPSSQAGPRREGRRLVPADPVSSWTAQHQAALVAMILGAVGAVITWGVIGARTPRYRIRREP